MKRKSVKSRTKMRQRAGAGGRRIEDVARLAGVSPITVSRTLNQPATVAERTRAAVQAAIDRIGYIPNRIAGGLASNNSRTIGMILPDIGHSTFAARVQGMNEVLQAEGYHLMLALSGYSRSLELAHVLAFLGQRVAGLALTGTTHDDKVAQSLARSPIPVLEFSTTTARPLDMLVGFSNEDACHAMVAYLARCGYRKIAFVCPPAANNDRSVARRTGYERACRELQLACDPGLVQEAPVGLANGAAAFVEVFARHPDLDAVFCTHDALAVGCMLEARRRNIDVPGDIGVAGFDDIELAREFLPALTSVRVKTGAIGRIAAQLLLRRIRGERVEEKIVDTGFEIVPRGSTKRPPAVA